MAYGITLENDGNELTLSDQGITYSYVGKATLFAINQPTANDNGTTVYKFDWAGDIIVALQLTTLKVSLLGYSKSGNTWTITVCSGNGNTTGFESQEAIEVYVFGSAYFTSSNYGIGLYDDNSNLIADLTRQPLTFTRISIPDPGGSDQNTNSYVIPSSVIKPAIIGYPTGRQTTSVKNPTGNFWTIRTFFTCWQISNGRLICNWLQRTFDNRSDGGTATFRDFYPTFGLLIDAAKY